jgi:hypothetical protein
VREHRQELILAPVGIAQLLIGDRAGRGIDTDDEYSRHAAVGFLDRLINEIQVARDDRSARLERHRVRRGRREVRLATRIHAIENLGPALFGGLGQCFGDRAPDDRPVTHEA